MLVQLLVPAHVYHSVVPMVLHTYSSRTLLNKFLIIVCTIFNTFDPTVADDNIKKERTIEDTCLYTRVFLMKCNTVITYIGNVLYILISNSM